MVLLASRTHVAHAATTAAATASVELRGINWLATRSQAQTNPAQAAWKQKLKKIRLGEIMLASMGITQTTKYNFLLAIKSISLRGRVDDLSWGPKSLGRDFSSCKKRKTLRLVLI